MRALALIFIFYSCQSFTDLERKGNPQISKTCQTTEDCVLTCEIAARPTPHRLWKFANDDYDTLGYGRRLTIPACDRPHDQADEEIVCDAFTEGVNSELKLGHSQLIPLSVSRSLKICQEGVRVFLRDNLFYLNGGLYMMSDLELYFIIDVFNHEEVNTNRVIDLAWDEDNLMLIQY